MPVLTVPLQWMGPPFADNLFGPPTIVVRPVDSIVEFDGSGIGTLARKGVKPHQICYWRVF